MDSRLVTLGLAADPGLYAAEGVLADEPEGIGPLTYRGTGPDYALLAVEMLLEGGLELLVEIPFELLFHI
ncbi:MAG TPA: hypothetical protein VLW46_00500 [Candidatus Bathyarchaeia archaeon]|nr:hypothetical protein [Candidatus Bathyarchaeia archaeon]